MSFDRTVKGNTTFYTYWSLDAFADHIADVMAKGGELYQEDQRNFWSGASMADALNMAHTGWEEKLAETLNISESAVELAEREHEVMRFTEVAYDVCGDSVDIGRYLAGEPECMMDWPLQPTSAVGRVITLCASVSASGSVDSSDLIERGQVIAALALALSHIGHSIELWVDASSEASDGSGKTTRQRILVKGANDTLDPARILYAFAHPSMLRRLVFAGYMNDEDESRRLHPDSAHPVAPLEDLPEGTLYLRHLLTGTGAPNADQELKRYLGELGLLCDD
jgi:hypothetical protein